jgi:hypothetical protein
MRQNITGPCLRRGLQQAGNANGLTNCNADGLGNRRRHEAIPANQAPSSSSVSSVARPGVSSNSVVRSLSLEASGPIRRWRPALLGDSFAYQARLHRVPGSDDYSLNGSSPETSATSQTIRTVIAAAKRYSLTVMGSRTRAFLGVREILSRLRSYCGPRSKMAQPPISARAYCLVRNPMTAIWWGEAGIPCSVSIGVSDCSSIPPDPRTDIWCALMGKPITSYCGNSPPAAAAALSCSKSLD